MPGEPSPDGGWAIAMSRARPGLHPRHPPTRFAAGLTEGETLKLICRDEGMPAASTVRLWVLDNVRRSRTTLRASLTCTRARGSSATTMADELVEISDDGTNDYVEKERQDGSKFVAFDAEHVQRSRLRVDTRKWLLSKALPKLYGDKLAIDAKVEDTTPTRSPLDRARRMRVPLRPRPAPKRRRATAHHDPISCSASEKRHEQSTAGLHTRTRARDLPPVPTKNSIH